MSLCTKQRNLLFQHFFPKPEVSLGYPMYPGWEYQNYSGPGYPWYPNHSGFEIQPPPYLQLLQTVNNRLVVVV